MPIAELLNESVTITPQTEDARHDATAGTGTDHDARIERRTRLVRTADGEEELSTHQVWIDGDVSVSLTDEVTADGNDLQIIRIQKPSALTGTHHTKLFLR